MLSPLPFKITAKSQGKPSEEHVFRCMGALSRFCSINREVINIAMIIVMMVIVMIMIMVTAMIVLIMKITDQ